MRRARVDLEAVRHNVAELRRRTGTPVMAVVKADAYGHGAVAVARAALDAGAAWLGVADLDEAVALRKAGIEAPVLCWLHGASVDLGPAARHGIALGVSSLEQLEAAAFTGVEVHLKTDTGLGRNGVAPNRLPAVLDAAARLTSRGLRLTGLFSHLANADDEADAAQLRAFDAHLALARARGLDPAWRHLASTAAALRHPLARHSLVRIGIGLYGLSPFEGVSSAELGLRPAMRLSGEVVAVKRVPAGSGVSYGLTYRTSAESTLALVGLGYADGVPRQASNAGPVSIRGRRYTVAGRIAMDQFVVDVGDAEVSVGDEAVLFGDPVEGVPSADEWAEAAGTINYEIVTRIGARVTREHRG